MNLQPPDWVSELQAALQREFGDGPRIAALATVDAEGLPQVRSIVIREIAPDGSVWFVTDRRSAKVTELSLLPAVQLMIWLPSQRVQYRLSGEVRRAVEIGVVQANWERLSEAAKEMFFWDAAGAGIGESAKPQATPPTAVPANFAVYRVWASKAEFLSLNERPHLRWIARESQGWQSRKITP